MPSASHRNDMGTKFSGRWGRALKGVIWKLLAIQIVLARQHKATQKDFGGELSL